MPLCLSMKEGDRVEFTRQQDKGVLQVTQISSDFTKVLVQNLAVFLIKERAREILPNVFASVGEGSHGGCVRLVFDAPPDVRILREKLT